MKIQFVDQSSFSEGTSLCWAEFLPSAIIQVSGFMSVFGSPTFSWINQLWPRWQDLCQSAIAVLQKNPTKSSVQFSQFSSSVMSNSLWLHESQHARPPCPSPTPRVYSNSCPLSRWCHPAISSSVIPFSSCPQSLPASESFPMSQLLHMRWPKYWSFSFSIIPSKEIPGLISFRMDWLDLLAVQGTLKSLLQHHSSKASIFWHSAFFTVQLSHPSIHDHRKNHSLDWTELCWQSNVSAFEYAI